MLTLLLLASYLQSLSASPLSDSSTGQTRAFIDTLVPRNGTDTSASGSASSDDDNTRTTYDIVSSCFGTIVACLWSAAHPNIDGPDDAGWTCLKRRVLNMIYAFIAPELITLWAMRQYVAAKFIMQDYNKNVAKAQPPKGTIKSMVNEYFGKVPETAVERKEVEPWTQTHAFFVQMGGFMLYDRLGRPKRVLTYDDLRHLITTNKIDPPGLNEKELADRNKSDWLSKAVAVLQTTWFVVQCITRRVEHLPITTLEVMTLAFAVLNAIVYWVWWNKPQGLGMGVCLKLKDDEDVPPRKSTDKAPSPAVATALATKDAHNSDAIEMERLMDSETTPADHSSPDTVPDIMSEPGPTRTPVRHSFLRRKLLKDREEFPWLLFILLRIPLRVGQTLLRPVGKIIGDTPPATLPNYTMRVPMYYSDVRGEGTAPWTTSCIIGIVFGALHLLAWSSPFPSWLEHTYWRIFSAISVALPALILVGTLLQPYTEEEVEEGTEAARQPRSRMHKLGVKAATGVSMVFGMIINLSTFSYMFGRFALLALALLALRDPGPRTLADIKWPSFIPHLF